MGIEKLREDQKRWNVMFGGGLGSGKPPAVRSSVAAKPKVVIECAHRGAELRREACAACNGKVQVKVFACEKNGECTISKSLPGVHVCDGDLEPFTLNGTRHFLYHIAAFKNTDTWRRNVEQVLRRLWLFNGKRVVAIASGEGLVDPDEVVAAFRDEVDTFVTPNNPELGEVVNFVPLLSEVEPYLSDVTFYAHAKAVSRPVNDGVTVHRWTDILYETNLDYFPVVFDLLQRHPIAGSFKKVGRAFRGSQSLWHFSGTFYWLRNRDLFMRPVWRNVDLMWGGTEAWPGIVFHPNEAGCIFHAGGSFNLYSMPYMTTRVLPELDQWRKAHEQQRLTI